MPLAGPGSSGADLPGQEILTMTFKRLILTTALGAALTAMTSAAHAQFAPQSPQPQQNQNGFWPNWGGWGNPMMQQGQPGLGWGWGGRGFGMPMMGGYGMPMMGGYGAPMMGGYGWSQNQGVWPGDPRQAMMAPFAGRVTSLDVDNDGTISADEAAAAADAAFTAMDSNGDGSLTKQEFTSANLGPGAGFNPARVAAMRSAKEQRFTPIDANTDGTIGKDEFLDQAKTQWEASDRDGDGRVTPFEHRSTVWN